MIVLFKRILNTTILCLALGLAGLILNNLLPGMIEKSSLIILLVSFFVLSLLVISVSFAGSSKNSESQTLFNFAAVGVKFVLSVVIALLYFEAFKKSGLNNILLFFVLYLTFTVYLLVVIVKVLNIRSLKRG